MIASLFQRVPLTTKVGLALTTLGLTSAQTEALDIAIAGLGKNPFISTLLGQEITSLNSGVAATVSLMGDVETENTLEGRRMLSSILKLEASRSYFADKILEWIDQNAGRVELTQVLEKISDLPIPGFGDTEHVDAKDFLVQGLLPYVRDMATPPQQDEEGVFVICPYCSEAYVHNLVNT